MASLPAHLQGKLAGLDARWSEPARSLPPPARLPSISKSHRPARPEHKSITLVNGEGFAFKGLPHRLKLTSDQLPSFTRDGFGRWLRLPRGAGADVITALYAREGIAWLTADGQSGPPRVRSTEQRLGLPGRHCNMPGPRVRYAARDLGERTARCYPSRSLVILHWATFGLEVTLMDYVATSQLVHLTTGNTKRDRKWWQLMSRFYPSTSDMEDRLPDAWSRAWTGGVAAGETRAGNH